MSRTAPSPARLLVATLAVALGAGLVAPGTPASGLPAAGPGESSDHRRPPATRALERALAVLAAPAPSPGRVAPGSPRLSRDHATLALRDLRVALPALRGADRQRASALLARPTDGAADSYGDGYAARSRRDCARHVCVHWVRRTRDAPRDRAWVERTLRTVAEVWRHEVGRLGYHRPLRDGGRGGDDRLDVYLADVGTRGLYGYCAPERARTGDRWSKPGYCVLDDDFARRQFGARPLTSLRVTAAHEFLHAVQFGYDYGEDRWLMESTATWVEERVFDGADDNRQYLDYGQVRRPRASLDTFDPRGFDQYGNWAFLEYLAQRFGRDVVRRTWQHAAGADRHYSVRAVGAALPAGTTFRRVFAAYAAANTRPATTYAEGRAWPEPRFVEERTLTERSPRTHGEVALDHLAAAHVLVRPADGLRSRAWRLEVRVDGPAGRTRPAATVLLTRASGQLVSRPVALDRDGTGALTVRFGARTARRATLTLTNASTRYRCWQGSLTYACQGDPRDEDRPFRWSLRVTRG